MNLNNDRLHTKNQNFLERVFYWVSEDLDADESKLKWKSQKQWFIILFGFNSCRSELNWRQNH